MLSIAVTKETISNSYYNPLHNDRYPWCLVDENDNVTVLCATVNIAEQIRNPHIHRLDTNNWFHNGWMDGFSIISNKPNNSPVALCTSDAICNQILNSLK